MYLVMASIVIWIVLLEHILPISAFAARKLCHAGCGMGIMLLDSAEPHARLFVYTVAAGSIAMTRGLSPLPAFRFSRPRDVGMTVYLCLVSAWFFMRLPAHILAPLFFADPAGAVVGKFFTWTKPARNKAWYQNKTVFGSAAVFAFTLCTV